MIGFLHLSVIAFPSWESIGVSALCNVSGIYFAGKGNKRDATAPRRAGR